MVMSGVVAKPNSSAPSSAAITTSRPGLQLAVSLHADAAAQIVHQQNLLSFRQAKLPRNSGVLNRAQWRRAGSAAVSADQHHIGVSFGDSRRDRAHSDLRHQLHRDPRLRIHVFQVVDQLRQIFNRIDVVMRRRRNQTYARNRVPQARDHVIHFVSRKLAAFARLRALRHLDLQFGRVHQVIRGHAESRRSHLLHRAAPRISVGIPFVALFVFAAFAGVRHSADAVHGNGQRLVRFLADRAKGHRAGGEPLHDFLRRLHFLDRNRLLADFLIFIKLRSVAMFWLCLSMKSVYS